MTIYSYAIVHIIRNRKSSNCSDRVCNSSISLRHLDFSHHHRTPLPLPSSSSSSPSSHIEFVQKSFIHFTSFKSLTIDRHGWLISWMLTMEKRSIWVAISNGVFILLFSTFLLTTWNPIRGIFSLWSLQWSLHLLYTLCGCICEYIPLISVILDWNVSN